ncbi:unnamed protein product [Rhizoctonia solani]|uniref:Fungal-type protein kinase domain-containing protein n=1 Tax=Rhizoctonia solani TaxID=456999 RepID=A0A8H3GSS0_9AGAM|nr:unnamed protein product [Rhizoctonia solani]
MLDRTDQGYDPAFTWRMNQAGRLDYYVNLPASAFTTQSPGTNSTANEDTLTHRFLVVDRLCHRRNICGRATIVLRIRKVEEDGSEGEGDEYTLKIMWRDPERGLEGEVLQKVKGKFGLAQHVWYGDAFGKCCCSPKVDGRWKCKKCVAETAQIDELQICDKLTNIAIEVPPEEGDKDPELTAIDTSVCHPTSQKRPRRIYTYIVMSSKGAVLGAILGYWGLFNIGILHRDISEGNVMMLSPDQRLVHTTGKGDPHMTCAGIKNSVLIESEKKLHEVLEQLGDRKPTGMLSDFDLHAFHLLDSQCEMLADLVGSGHTDTEIIEPGTTSTPPSRPPTISLSSRSHGSRPREDDTTVDVPLPKKRRFIGRHRASANAAETQPTTQSNDDGIGEKKRLIDFRTGTPAFMSVRVLTFQSGERYHHSFMEDLESFFWLVLWSAAAHLDQGRLITPHAQLLLNRLNQTDLFSLRSEKAVTLFNCYMQDSKDMLDLLELIDNEWATHPIFVDVIIEFGRLAYSHYDSQHLGHSPVDVFPEVVRIFQDALASNDD